VKQSNTVEWSHAESVSHFTWNTLCSEFLCDGCFP